MLSGTYYTQNYASIIGWCLQHRAAHFVLNEFSRYASVTMINKLKWTTLQCQRNIDKLIMFYEILTVHVSLDFQSYLHVHMVTT